MSVSQLKQEDELSDSDCDDDDGDKDGLDFDQDDEHDEGSAKNSVEKQRLKAYKKHQNASKKKGSYEPPGIANPLLQSLDEEVGQGGGEV